MTKLRTEKSFVERFEHVDDQVPMSNEDAKLALAGAGVDAVGGLDRLFAELDGVEATERKQRFAKAEVRRQRELAGLGGPQRSLGPVEVRQQLELYRQKYPDLRAQFRSFEGASDDDRRALLEEIEELIRRASEK